VPGNAYLRRPKPRYIMPWRVAADVNLLGYVVLGTLKELTREIVLVRTPCAGRQSRPTNAVLAKSAGALLVKFAAVPIRN
jgi:hypothetical protein